MSECDLCAQIRMMPTSDWEALLIFVCTQRRYTRFVETLWQCGSCGGIWVEREMKSTGQRTWSPSEGAA